jgi:hypothetical protein
MKAKVMSQVIGKKVTGPPSLVTVEQVVAAYTPTISRRQTERRSRRDAELYR